MTLELNASAVSAALLRRNLMLDSVTLQMFSMFPGCFFVQWLTVDTPEARARVALAIALEGSSVLSEINHGTPTAVTSQAWLIAMFTTQLYRGYRHLHYRLNTSHASIWVYKNFYIWWFPKIGVPPNKIIHCCRISYYKPTSYGGYPQ